MENTNDIIWMRSQEETTNVACPICNSRETKTLMLKAKNPLCQSEWFCLYQCNACESCFYEPFIPPQYEIDFGSHSYTDFYVEQGAGIDFMVRPLVWISKSTQIKSFLDVGCGFGFAVDFAERMLLCKGVGVEPSRYGQIGAALLGREIYNAYLEEVQELQDTRFDVIMASEVIEHVPKPYEFISSLKTHLNPEGILILTTPNSRYINEQTPIEILLETLYLDFHFILFSPNSIEFMLRQSGFKNIFVFQEGHRLVIFASDSENFHINQASETEFRNNYYIPYLVDFFQNRSEEDRFYDGIGWRLFKEYVNLGKLEEALEVYEILRKSLISKYGQKIEHPQLMYDTILEIQQFEDLPQYTPCFIAGLYYYLGLCFLNKIIDYTKSAMLFQHSFEISKKLLSLSTVYFCELADLLWRAKFHEGLSYLYAKQPDKAHDIFGFMLKYRTPHQEFSYVGIPEDLLERTVAAFFQASQQS